MYLESTGMNSSHVWNWDSNDISRSLSWAITLLWFYFIFGLSSFWCFLYGGKSGHHQLWVYIILTSGGLRQKKVYFSKSSMQNSEGWPFLVQTESHIYSWLNHSGRWNKVLGSSLIICSWAIHPSLEPRFISPLGFLKSLGMVSPKGGDEISSCSPLELVINSFQQVFIDHKILEI